MLQNVFDDFFFIFFFIFVICVNEIRNFKNPDKVDEYSSIKRWR